MDLALDVVPVKGESDVSRSFPIYVDFLVFLQDADEVVRIFLTHLFYSKVVNNECEADGLPFVLPETGRCLALIVPHLFECLISCSCAINPACGRP